MRLVPTKHFFGRYEERFGKLKDLDRLLKNIKRSGKWFEDNNGYLTCVLNNLMVFKVDKRGETLHLMTVFPYTKTFKGELNKMEKIPSPFPIEKPLY